MFCWFIIVYLVFIYVVNIIYSFMIYGLFVFIIIIISMIIIYPLCAHIHIYIYLLPIGSMYAIYGNIYHQYTPNVSIDTIHGSYGLYALIHVFVSNFISVDTMDQGHASVEVIANASASLVFWHAVIADRFGTRHGMYHPWLGMVTILLIPPIKMVMTGWWVIIRMNRD